MKKLAIIKSPDFGLRDIGRMCLSFSTYTEGQLGALQVITNPKQIEQILQDAEVESFKDLEGKPCWIEEEGNIIRFLSAKF